MSLSRFNIVTWLTGYSGWASYCALISVFGLTAYYAELLRPHVPDWVGVGLLIAPLVVILFIEWGVPDRLVAAAHIFAASWFMRLLSGWRLGSSLATRRGGQLFTAFLLTWVGLARGQASTVAPEHIHDRPNLELHRMAAQQRGLAIRESLKGCHR